MASAANRLRITGLFNEIQEQMFYVPMQSDTCIVISFASQDLLPAVNEYQCQ
jgi:hypothetical protein